MKILFLISLLFTSIVSFAQLPKLPIKQVEGLETALSSANYKAFSSVSALKASGFYGDGKAAKILDGGREFAWNGESLADDDNGVTTIKLTGVPAGAYERIFTGTVRAAEIGVKSDGTNQTTLLNSLFSLSTVKEVLFDNGDITISGTVNFQSKKGIFQNNARLIGGGTVKNIQVIADRKSPVFATTLNTDAAILTKTVSIMWWGALPQANYNTGNGIDNYDAITRAIASQKLQTSVYIPGADTTDANANLGYFYYCSRPIPVESRIELYGDGAGKSVIYIPGDSLGINLKWGSSGSHLHDFEITGNWGSSSPGFNSSTAHGIWVQSNSNVIQRVTVQHFSGDGIFINGDVGSTPYTNANNNKLKDVAVYANGRHGLDFQGGDANNCSIESADATGNAQVNIADRSFLGNFFQSCHTASAAIDHPLNKSVVTHGGSYYLAKENSLGVEPGVTSGWQTYWQLRTSFAPSFSAAWNIGTQYYQTAGYLASDPNQLGHFSDCYAEGDQIIVTNKGSSTFMGGFAAASGSTDGSIGSRQGTLTSKNYQVYNFTTNNALRLDASDLSIQWTDPVAYPLGFTGSASAGTISSTWANGAGGSATTLFASPAWTGATSFLGRDRVIQGNHVHLVQIGGAMIGTHDYANTARLIAFGAAAPTSGDFGIGDVVVNTNPASSVLMWQCSVASVTGNGGTWTAVSKSSLSGLTSGRIPVANSSTTLTDYPDLTYNSTNATATVGGVTIGNYLTNYRRIWVDYTGSNNGGLESRLAGVSQFFFGMSNDGTYGGTSGTNSGRFVGYYDLQGSGWGYGFNGSGDLFIGSSNASYTARIGPSGHHFSSNVAFGNSTAFTPTAKIHIAAGTATSGTAPLKFTAGTNVTPTEAGAVEYDGSHLYFTATNGGTRYQLDQQGGGGMTNPMTTANDIIIGGASGTPTRLAVGGEGTALTVSGGNVTWASGTPWNGNYANSSSGDLGGSTFGNTNTTLQVHTGGAGTTTLPLVSGGYTKVLHFVNQGTGNLTIARQGTDQIFYHGANATSFILAPGGSAVVGLLNSKWVVWFDGYNPTGSAATLTTPRTIWGQSFDGSANVTGDITLGTGNLTMTGSIGATGARATKVWATDGEFTNMPTIGGTSLSSTTSTLTNKTIASATNNVEGTLLNVRAFSSGTTYTPTTGTTKAVIILIGAGGGGGGASGAASSVGAASGGGGGGLLVKYITGVTGTYTYAIGAGGTAGANTGSNGGTGGNTTFTNGGTTYTAFGGSPGLGQTAGTTAAILAPGAGAVVSTNGDINGGGDPGTLSYRISGTLGWSGNGGSSEYGGGGVGLTAAGAGNNATGFGSGGGGALSTANTNRAGGTGSGGLMIVYEYK